MLTRRRSTASSRVHSVIAGEAMAVLSAPLLARADEGTLAAVAVTVVALAVAVLAARATAVLVPRPRLAWLGAIAAAVALALIGVTPRGVITIAISVVLGAG